MVKKITGYFATVLTFLSSTGFVYFGVTAAAFLIWFLAPKTLGWVGWILVGIFIQKNMDLIRPWALKQYNDLKSKI